jgi:hypothetical protein
MFRYIVVQSCLTDMQWEKNVAMIDKQEMGGAR